MRSLWHFTLFSGSFIFQLRCSVDVQFALSLRFLYLCGMEKILIERLTGRNLSELLHVLRQEQRTERVTDVL